MLRASPTEKEALFWVRIASLGRGTVYSFFLHWILLASKNRFLNKKGAPFLLYLPAALNLAAFSFIPAFVQVNYVFRKTSFGYVALPTPTFWNYFFTISNAVFVILAIFLIIRFAGTSSQARERKQAYGIALAVAVAFALSWPRNPLLPLFRFAPGIPIASFLFLFPLAMIFFTTVRYRISFALPLHTPSTSGEEILDRPDKSRLYTFLAFVYFIDGLAYLTYSSLVLQEPLYFLLPWGTLFVLLGSSLQFLATLRVGEDVRDTLYVFLVSLTAFLLAPRVLLLNEVLYALFFFTAVLVAVLLGNVRLFLLQALLMGGILLVKWWRGISSLPHSPTGFHALLFAFALFTLLAAYVHRVYRKRLRESQEQFAFQKMLSGLVAEFVDLKREHFEGRFPQILQRIAQGLGKDWEVFFLLSSSGKNLLKEERWVYTSFGEDSPEIEPISPEMLFCRPTEGIEECMLTTQEDSLLQRFGLQNAFFYPVQAGEKLLGFLGWGSRTGQTTGVFQRELGKTLASVLADTLLRLAREQELHRLALHDPLTGLPNRRLFEEHLEKAIRFAKRSGNFLAVVFLDLDNFKEINDRQGHEVGDMVLREVAQRLLKCVREYDTVARFGGDEFVCLFSELKNPHELFPLLDRVTARLREPVFFRDREFSLTMSAGIALFPQDGETPQELIRKADLAMYQVKARGKGRYTFVTPFS